MGQNPANAINAISKTGIAPLYPTFFEGGMFAPATVIEKENPLEMDRQPKMFIWQDLQESIIILKSGSEKMGRLEY